MDAVPHGLDPLAAEDAEDDHERVEEVGEVPARNLVWKVLLVVVDAEHLPYAPPSTAKQSKVSIGVDLYAVKKYPYIAMDILWRVFHMLTEPVLYTFVSVSRRNNEARAQIGKLAAKYPWMYGYFYSVGLA